MRKQFLATMTMVPLLLAGSHAAQPRIVATSQPLEIFSDESGGYLGVDISDITSDRVEPLKLREEKGVEVTMVDQDAPAFKAGIKEHDVILTLNGTPVESKSQLHRMIRETPAGRTIALGLSRDGQPMTIKVQLEDRDKEFDSTTFKGKEGKEFFHFEIPTVMPDLDMPDLGVLYVRSSTRSGVMVESLTPQLSEFFGVKNGSGVLVRSVEKGSRAEKAGLHAGDVIIKVDDRAVHDTDDFAQAMHSRRSSAVHVGVIRDKKEQTFTLTLPERKDSGKKIEESLEEAPEMDAKAQAELSDLKNDIARLRPQIETAQADAMKMSAQQLKQQAEQLQKELGPEIQKEMQQNGQKLKEQMRDQLEQLRQQMQASSFDI